MPIKHEEKNYLILKTSLYCLTRCNGGVERIESDMNASTS